MKEYPISSKIESCKLIYQVKESDTCEGCAFMFETENTCTISKEEEETLETCCGWLRKDGKNVIFKHVGEL